MGRKEGLCRLPAGEGSEWIRPDQRDRMAANYGELMTFQQFADLVRYLEPLKGQDKQM